MVFYGKKKYMKKVILTGDRPTGPLHLGHYVGSIKNRVELQDEYNCYFIIADYQVLTDKVEETKNIKDNIHNIVLDYLSLGIDPKKCSIFVESQIPEIPQLSLIFSMLTTFARVKRNPTIKEQIQAMGIKNESLGYISWPVTQAADILSVRADLVPVGKDQLPHIEMTREVANKFNNTFGDVFNLPESKLGDFSILPGLDGQKMSKSRGNAIFLTDSPKIVEEKLMKAITDPKKIRIDDPGRPNICNIYKYYEAFYPEVAKDISEKCRKGELGCVACKKDIGKLINEFLDPIREKRNKFSKEKGLVESILEEGRKKTRKRTEETLALVKQAMKINY